MHVQGPLPTLVSGQWPVLYFKNTPYSLLLSSLTLCSFPRLISSIGCGHRFNRFLIIPFRLLFNITDQHNRNIVETQLSAALFSKGMFHIFVDCLYWQMLNEISKK